MRKCRGRWGRLPLHLIRPAAPTRCGESPAVSGARECQACRIALRVPGGGKRLTQPSFPPFNKAVDFPPARANIAATQVTHIFITFHEMLPEK